MKTRVVMYNDERGNWRVYADDGVEVYYVDELAPDDRVYRMAPRSIPDGILDGDIGHRNDGSPAAIRSDRIAREMQGMPAFDVVTNES